MGQFKSASVRSLLQQRDRAELLNTSEGLSQLWGVSGWLCSVWSFKNVARQFSTQYNVTQASGRRERMCFIRRGFLQVLGTQPGGGMPLSLLCYWGMLFLLSICWAWQGGAAYEQLAERNWFSTSACASHCSKKSWSRDKTLTWKHKVSWKHRTYHIQISLASCICF